MAAQEPPVFGKRMHWHLQQSNSAGGVNENLEKFNKIFACWGTSEAQGASDQLLRPQGFLFLLESV